MRRYFISSMILAAILMASPAMTASVQPVPGSHPALAGYDIPACTDNQGQNVRYVSTKDKSITPLVFVAGARYLNSDRLSQPAIFYDPKVFKAESTLVRDFVFAHECYHLSSGDVHNAYEHKHEHGRHLSSTAQETLEYDADCHAAYRMKHEFGYALSDMAELRTIVNMTTPTGKQETRMQDIIACFNNSRPS